MPTNAGAQVTFLTPGAAVQTETTSAAPALPTGWQAGDIFLLVGYTSLNLAHTATAGWTEVSTQQGAANVGRLSVGWRRAVAGDTAPTLTVATNNNALIARVFGFRGCATSGNPWDGTAAAIQPESALVTFTGDALTTSVNNTMTVFVGGAYDNNNWTAAGGSVDTIVFTAYNATNDNAMFLAYDSTPTNTAGTQAAPTATQVGPDAGYSLTLALKPPPPTITVAAGTNPGNTSITNGGVAALDAFTLTVAGGPATVSSVTYSMTGNTSASNVFVSSSSTCTGGTTYGTDATPTAGEAITVSGLSAPNGTSTYYLCMTANSTAGTATGYASTVAATGFTVSGASSAGTTVTITQPSIVVAAGTNPADAAVSSGSVAALDEFALTVAGGPATVSSVTYSMTGSASASNVFVSSSSTCTGGTTYGTDATPTAGEAITVSGLSAANGTSTYYLCMTANSTAGTVTGYASTVAATGFSVSGTSSAGTTVTIKSIAVSAGANPGNTSISTGAVAALDAFTLTVAGGPATLSTVTYSMTGSASASNVFVNSVATCDGTTYGTDATPSAGEAITVAGLSAPNGSSTYYLCMTASGTAGTATGYASTVAATGFSVSGASSAGTTVTVSAAQTITVAAGTNPGNTSIGSGAVAALDAFTLTVTGGPATLSTVTYSMTGSTSASNVFIHSNSACSGGTTFGTDASPTAGEDITVSGLSAPNGTTTYYLCMTANATPGSVTGYATTVAATGFSVSGTSSAGTTVTVTAPAANLTLADYKAGTSESSNATIAPNAIGAVDTFALTSDSTSVVTGATVTLTYSAGTPVASVGVYPNPDCTGAAYGTLANPPAGANAITFSSNITVGTTQTNYYVCVTAKNWATVTTSPTVTGRVTALATTSNVSGTDANSATITIDGTNPGAANLTMATGVSGGANLTWTNPADTDLAQVIILKRLGSSMAATATDGQTYVVDDTIGTGTVAYVGPIATSGNAPGLAPGTWYFRVILLDTHGNYSAASNELTATVSSYVGEGDVTDNSLKASVSIINPGSTPTGAALKVGLPLRVQARVASPSGGGNVSSVTLLIDGTPYAQAMTQNANYGGTLASGVWEVQVTALGAGPHTLQAKAVNASGPAEGVLSRKVPITYDATKKGDGNLLVRDNASQMCSDCHSGIMTHSSETTSNAKGSWSLACRDCHTPHRTRNIGLIREQIAPPSYTQDEPTRAVQYYSRTEGVPGGAANTNYNGVCQVCHTQTKYYTQSAYFVAPATGNHETGKNCVSCHDHSKGLKASCTGCHGTSDRPPSVSGTDANLEVAPPAVSTDATIFVTDGGLHLKHVDQATYRTNPLQCSDCHQTQVHNTTTEVDWFTLAESNLPWPNGVVVTPPTGAVAAGWTSSPTCTNWCHGDGLAGNGTSRSFSWALPGGALQCWSCHGNNLDTPLPAQAAAHHPQNVACSNCHPPGYTASTLDATAKTTHISGTVDHPTGCRACHGKLVGFGGAVADNTAAEAAPGFDATSVDTRGNTARTNVGVGAHIRHVNAGTFMSGKCAACHVVPANLDVAHADAGLDWGWSATFGVTPSYAAPNCTVFCHSNAQPLNGTLSSPSISWTTTPAQSCTTCHQVASFGGTGLSATHGSHMTGYTYTCDECHTATMQDDSSGIVGTVANHLNAFKNVSFSAIAFPGDLLDQSGGFYSGYTCTSTYCHSQGTTTTSPFLAPTGTVLSWNNGVGTMDADCDNCHGGNASATQKLATQSHDEHVNNAAVIGANYGCVTCHDATVDSDVALDASTGFANHVDGQKDVTAASWVAGTKGCGTNYCHSNGRDPGATDAARYANATWGTTTLTCKGCHGRGAAASPAPDYADGATLAEANSHSKHTSLLASSTSCVKCHSGLVNASGDAILGSSHTNGTREVVIAAAYDTNGASSNYNSGTKTCSNVSCHGSSQPVWGTTVSCSSCHGGYLTPRTPVAGADANLDAAPPYGLGLETASTTRAVGAHLAHANQISLRQNALACAECHSGATHEETKEVVGGPIATTGGKSIEWNGTTCASTYCHSPGGTEMGGTDRTPTWTGGSTEVTCGACHGATPPVDTGAGDHPQNTSCEACHGTGYVNGALTASAKDTHINQSSVGGTDKPNNGCTACHGVLAGVAGAAVLNTSMTSAPGYVGGTTGVDTHGANAVANPKVGAHDAHVRPAGSRNSVAALDCSNCHGTKPVDGNTDHADATIGIGWSTLATNGGAMTPRPTAFDATFEATPNCSTIYCHSNASPLNGTASSPAFSWTSATDMLCSDCHATSTFGGTGLSAKHSKHLTGGYAYTCDECHAPTMQDDSSAVIATVGNHVNRTKDVDFSATAFPTDLVNQSGGNYLGAATYTCTSTYCHSGGVATSSPFSATASAQIGWSTGTSTCRSCHGWDAAAAPTIGVSAGSSFQGSANHAGHVANASVIGTNYVCADCHVNVVSTGNSPITTFSNHVNGVKNVSIATRGSFASNEPYTGGSCSSTYCHSSGQATPAYRTIAWSAAAIGCNGCHGTGTTAGAPDYASGGAGVPTSNSHLKHTGNGATAATCDDCHTGIATSTGGAIVSASTLHTDGSRTVAIAALYDSNGATSNYTAGTKTCNNITCHGAGTPQWGGPPQTCTNCHGSGSDNPSWDFDDGAISSISTGTEWTTYGHGSATVGFAGANVCLYCHDDTVSHSVADNPFRLRGASTAASGITGAYNSASATNGNDICINCHDADAASRFGVDPDGASGGYVVREAASKFVDAWHYREAAQGGDHSAANDGGMRCWDCHDPHGDGTNVAMIHADPLRESADAYGFAGTRSATAVVFTNKTTSGVAGGYVTARTGARNGVCQVCHTATDFWRADGLEPSQDHNVGTNCADPTGGCHAHQQPPNAAFKGSGSCIDCHSGSQTKTGDLSSIPREAVYDDFLRPSRHVYSGTGRIVTNWDCILCHAEGNAASATGAADAALHGGDNQATHNIDLRNVDTNTAITPSWPGRRTGGFLATSGQRDAMDTFCMSCHDSNGASGIAVNVTGDGLTTSPTTQTCSGAPNNKALRPFNCSDTIGNGRDSATINALRTRVLNVRDQFNSGNAAGKAWASHHNLNQFTKRYTTNNTTFWPTAAWDPTTAVTKDGVALYGTGAGAGVTAGLHCSDCHLNETNAHGTANTWYMLADRSGGDNVFQSSGTSSMTDTCAKCHNRLAYTNSGGTTAGRFTHSECSRVGNTTIATMGGGGTAGITCLGCHGGDGSDGVLGKIHGNNGTYIVGRDAGGSTSKKYRFMGMGGSMRWYSPNNSTTVTDPAGWQGTTNVGCYTITDTDPLTFGSCTQHDAGFGAKAVNRARNLEY